MIGWIVDLLVALLMAAGVSLAPVTAAPASERAHPPRILIPAVAADPTPVAVETVTAAPIRRGCALYAGPQLEGAEVLAELRLHDWAPFSPETMLELFRRESGLYLAAENLCTDDHGIPQINRPYHGAWCDVVRVKVDLAYAIRCAARIFAEQGISAWIAAKGWLW